MDNPPRSKVPHRASATRTARSKTASAAGSKEAARAKPQRNIQSIEVGFRLIRALEQAPGPMSLKLLSQRAGMEPSKAHLYLVSFCNLGLVRQEDSGYYALGSYALQLGLAALNKIDLAHLARKVLHELRDETGEAVSLAVHGDKGPVIVAKADGLKDDPLVIRLGRTLRVSNSAAGRIFLTYSDADSVRRLLEAEIARGEVTAEVTTAHPLDDAQLTALADKLKAREGRSIKLKTTVDPEILGGLVVRIGSQMIDSSIRTRLNSLAQAMKA